MACDCNKYQVTRRPNVSAASSDCRASIGVNTAPTSVYKCTNNLFTTCHVPDNTVAQCTCYTVYCIMYFTNENWITANNSTRCHTYAMLYTCVHIYSPWTVVVFTTVIHTQNNVETNSTRTSTQATAQKTC